MKCEECDQTATVHVTEVDDKGKEGKHSVRHLCAEHASRLDEAQGIRYPHVLLAERVPITVDVTQAQIDNEDSLTVRLPDGASPRVQLPKGLAPAWTSITFHPSAGGKTYELHFRLVPDAGQ